MDAAFAAYFRDIHRRQSESFEPYRRMSELVQRAAGEQRLELRIDAAYFLTSNLVAMFDQPLRQVRGTDALADPKIASQVEHDVTLILQSAREQGGTPLLTAAAIAKGIGASIDRLFVNSLEIWGES